MKRSIFFCLILFTGVALSAQNSVSISGFVKHHDNQNISLRINDFDTDKMVGPGDAAYRTHHHDVKAEIWPDSSFTLTTDEITQAFTICTLNFGRETKELILSPGDSLVVNLDYWTFNYEIEFQGKGSGKNDYWNDAIRVLKEREGKKMIGNLRSKTRIKERIKLMTEQLEFLEEFRAVIDSAFWNWESRRIRYNCYDSNVRFIMWYNDRSSDHLDVTEPYDSVNLKDEEALLTIQSYRTLIRNYQKIHTAPQSSIPNGDMLLMFHLGDSNFSGLTRTYFLWNVISGAVNDAVDKKQKQLIVDFAVEHIKDPATQALLQNLEGELYGGFVLGKSFSGAWANASYTLGGIFILGMLIILIRSVIYNRRRKTKSMNFSFVRTILILVFLGFVLFIIGNDGKDSIVPYLFLLSIIGFMVIHNRIPLRWFAMKQKYMLYIISTLILLGGFYLVIHYTLKGSYNSFNRDDIYDSVLPVFIITSSLMIPYAFIYYYAGIVRKHKNGWSHLIEQKIVSLEAVFHILIVSAIFIEVASNMSRAEDLLTLFEIIIGLLVFYVTAYVLIINNLFKKKYIRFFIYSLLSLVGFSIIVSTMGGISTFTGLHSRGIPISFLKSLEFPSFDLMIFALPAIIYAWARKIFIERGMRGYSLYHQKEAELNQLRSQVNPHFLFNSLNTVYAFALKEGNEKTAESIAKLANLMRYLIDDMEQESIPIRKEIGYIEDYIKLQSIRSSVEHDIKINVELDDEQIGEMIAPMLMIPFVENAFKHGINPNNSSELKISVSMVENAFQFVIENSVNQNLETFEKEKGFGIGIENVKKRLEFIYPGKHTLSIADTHDRFIVIMTVEL